MLHREVWQVVRLQVALTALASLLAACLAADARTAAFSALAGGGIAVVGALIYASIAYARKRAAPQDLMRGHFRAEAMKMIATVFLFAAIMVFFKGMSALALFGGYIAAQSAYWFGLLVK